MKIVIDQNIPAASETFGQHGTLHHVDGRHLTAAQCADAEALIVRSVTRVDARLLRGSAVRFVATATIGTDHLDIPWLGRTGIEWAAAPGCNADAAAQYSLAMIFRASQLIKLDLARSQVGIVGHGNVGSRLTALLRTCGIGQVLACDPPLADQGTAGLTDMHEISDCDVISFHVPLTRTGKYPTHHLCNEHFLSQLGRGCLLVNTARGEVVDGAALLSWLTAERGFAALDAWPAEPLIDADLLDACILASPHVAGYSMDGKIRGTWMTYLAFCKSFGFAPVETDIFSSLPRHQLITRPDDSPSEVVLAACPVERDDDALRRALKDVKGTSREEVFDTLRRDYPDRRDFAGWNLQNTPPPQLSLLLQKLGFH